MDCSLDRYWTDSVIGDHHHTKCRNLVIRRGIILEKL